MTFLTEEEKGYVRTYKYCGGDSSPIYKYVLSPFAQFCVDTFVPKSVAPNLITFLGLIISVSSFVMVMIFNPNLSNDAPRWLHFYVGSTILIYQTLDNMDGKQARRTNSSSALGMFFDHGCDAVNTGIASVAMGSVLGTGWTGKIFLCYFCSFIPFYMQTWEEYYSGAMVLPEFNGPSEGLLLSALTAFIAGCFGSDFLHAPLFIIPDHIQIYLPKEGTFFANIGFPTKEIPSFTLFTGFFLVVFVAVIGTVILHIGRVTIALGRQKEFKSDANHHQLPHENHTVINALKSLFPFAVFFTSTYNYLIYSFIALNKYPVATVVLFCLVFSDLAMHLMISHIIHRKLQTVKRTPTYLLGLLTIFGNFGHKYLMTHHDISMEYFEKIEACLLLFTLSYSFVHVGSTVIQTCHSFAEALDVYTFKLGKRHSQ